VGVSDAALPDSVRERSRSFPDPRAENSRHDLVEILLIAFLAVLCGAQHCSEMAAFGRAKLKFLKRFLKLRP
jgi:hypothetical protein